MIDNIIFYNLHFYNTYWFIYTFSKGILMDISNFNKVSDYLPILNGCLIVDLFFMILLYNNIIIKSKYLEKWYEKYQLSAVMADVLIIFIGILLTRYFYHYLFNSFSLWKFIGLAVFIQIIHDILFYLFFSSVPRGYNAMLDFFKDYSKEVKLGAITSDSCMIIIACLLSSYLASYSLNTNLIILIISLYITPYLINFR